MSRVGKKSIVIPPGVEVQIQEDIVRVKGPKGEIITPRVPRMRVEQTAEIISVFPMESDEAKLSKKDRALWGLARQLISNMVDGVTKGYEKKLEIEGVGYRAAVEGKELVLSVGYSKPVRLMIPEGISAIVEKNLITVSGIEKDRIGQFAAVVKRVRKVEPYKGKGIRYQGEFVRRKLGKKAVGASGKK